jgi:hypothetical protein
MPAARPESSQRPAVFVTGQAKSKKEITFVTKYQTPNQRLKKELIV